MALSLIKKTCGNGLFKAGPKAENSKLRFCHSKLGRHLWAKQTLGPESYRSLAEACPINEPTCLLILLIPSMLIVMLLKIQKEIIDVIIDEI